MPIGGPIRGGSGPPPIRTGDRAVFTVLAALAMALLLLTYPRWSADLFARPTEQPRASATSAASPIPTAPTASSLSSAWVSQEGYPSIRVGGLATVTVRYRNTGTATWRRGTPAEVRLGIVGEPAFDPSMALDWPYPERPAVQSEATVAPGQVATFSFKVRGTHPGVFRLRLRPVVDGVAWLTDEGAYIDVEVR